MIKFTPNEDRVLIEPEPVGSKIGLIYIPDIAKDKPNKGVVAEIGDDPKIKVKVGDKVFYGKYAGTDIVIDGKDYKIMRNSDVFGSYED